MSNKKKNSNNNEQINKRRRKQSKKSMRNNIKDAHKVDSSHMTDEERLEARKKAYRLWALNDGGITFVRLALETGLSVKELRTYKRTDRWEHRYKRAIEKGTIKRYIKDQAKDIANAHEYGEDINQIQEIFDEYNLTEREQLLVIYYLQDFNITQAAIRAGYAKASAHTKGRLVFDRPRVQNALKRVKAIMQEQIYLTANDIINEYIRIAFADMTNYVEFNDKDVRLKDSSTVDGRLIQEVRNGPQGTTIKLADKMRALDKLEKLFDIVEDKRLALEKEKFEFQKELAGQAKDGNTNITIVNDLG